MDIKIKTLALYIFSFHLLLCSCTVEKRHYTNGFYVNWIKGNHKSPIEYKSPGLSASVEGTRTLEIPVNPKMKGKWNKELSVNVSSLKNSKPCFTCSQYIDGRNLSFKSFEQLKEIETGHSRIEIDDGQEKPKVNNWALASFLSITLLLFTFSLIGPYVSLALLFFTIVAAGIAFKQFNEKPGYYSGKGFATFGLIAAIVVAVIVIIAAGAFSGS